MSQPSASIIVRRRHWALLAIRTLSLLMTVCGLVQILQAIGNAFGYAWGGSSFLVQLLSVFYENNHNAFWYGISLMLPGLALAWSSRRLSRWIVPVAANDCPSCGYTLQQLTATRCPECGYQLKGDRDAQSLG